MPIKEPIDDIPKTLTFQYKGFYTNVRYNPKCRKTYGCIGGIEDLVTFVSDNINEVEIEFQKAVDDYLIFCAEIGKKVKDCYIKK